MNPTSTTIFVKRQKYIAIHLLLIYNRTHAILVASGLLLILSICWKIFWLNILEICLKKALVIRTTEHSCKFRKIFRTRALLRGENIFPKSLKNQMQVLAYDFMKCILIWHHALHIWAYNLFQDTSTENHYSQMQWLAFLQLQKGKNQYRLEKELNYTSFLYSLIM